MEQFFSMYGGTLVLGFLVTLFLLVALLLSKRLRVEENIHHTPSRVSRLGGVALIIGFLLVLLASPIAFFPLSWWVFCGALVVALGVGLWDDFRGLNWRYQLAAQGGILALLYAGGVRILTITNPFGGVLSFTDGAWVILGFVIFLIWGILVLNSINWLDGVDGLCASVLMVTFGTLFFLSLSPFVYQPAVAILLAAALGGALAFLVVNFPPAKIIGGTTGSLFFGIVVVFVSVVAGTKIATTLLVLALPITDTAFVLMKRWWERRSLFQPDYGHLHHVLQQRGWSSRSIVLAYTLLTIIIGIIALSTETLGKFTALVWLFGILVITLTFFHLGKSVSKRWLLIPGSIFLALAAFTFWHWPGHSNVQNAWIGGQWYALEVADSPKEREQGLSGKEGLCGKCGMVFVFPEPITPLFWMKDMRFSIDVLWLQDDVVIAKDEQVPFPSLETFGPGLPVTKVIELPAGAAKDIPIGTKIYFW